MLDDVSGKLGASTWARGVLLREAGRILADRQRHDDTDGCGPFRDEEGACAICGAAEERPVPTREEEADGARAGRVEPSGIRTGRGRDADHH